MRRKMKYYFLCLEVFMEKYIQICPNSCPIPKDAYVRVYVPSIISNKRYLDRSIRMYLHRLPWMEYLAALTYDSMKVRLFCRHWNWFC